MSKDKPVPVDDLLQGKGLSEGPDLPVQIKRMIAELDKRIERERTAKR